MGRYATEIFLFDEFTLDTARKFLLRSGEFVALTPKALETLIVLVKNYGVVVEKNYLLDEVWANTFVEEATLAQNISTIRKTLGEDGHRRFIETVPRRGYRFIMEVKEFFSTQQLVKFEGFPEEKTAGSEDENNVVEINMTIQAVVSNKKNLKFSISRLGDNWVMLMQRENHKH